MSATKSFTFQHATLERVIDGDTIDVTIDVGFRFTTKQRLRLLNYDTPERGEAGFQEATDHLIELLSDHDSLQVTTFKQDSFGRWLSLVRCSDVDINRAMHNWMIQFTATPAVDGALPASDQ